MGCAPSTFLPPPPPLFGGSSKLNPNITTQAWAIQDARQYLTNSTLASCIFNDDITFSCHPDRPPQKLLCADTTCTLQRHQDVQQQPHHGNDKPGNPNEDAIIGLHSTWITPYLLAMAQPSDSLMQKYQILNQLQQFKVAAIVNLQVPGEHSICGYSSVQAASGFSYTPEHFMRHNILYYNFPWRRTSLKSMDYTLSVIQVVDSILADGGRVAIHCHSGHMRTCFIVACYLVFSKKCPPLGAMTLVCKQRPNSLKPKHLRHIQEFQDYTSYLTSVYVRVQQQGLVEASDQHKLQATDFKNKFASLETFMDQQRKILYGEEARIYYHIPKVVHCIAKELVIKTTRDKRVREKLARAFLHELEYEFGNDVNPIFTRDAYIVNIIKSKINDGDYSDVPELDVHNLLRLLLDWIRQLGQPILPDWVLTSALSKGDIQTAIVELQKSCKCALATFQILACWMYQIIPSKARLTRRLYGGLAHVLLKHTRLHNLPETTYYPRLQNTSSKKSKPRFSIISKVTRGVTRFKPTILEVEYGLLLETAARYWCKLASSSKPNIHKPSSSKEQAIGLPQTSFVQGDDAPKLYSSNILNVTYLNQVEPLFVNRPSLDVEPLDDDLIKNLEETSDLAHPSSLLWV